jgi:hypothetical protein
MDLSGAEVVAFVLSAVTAFIAAVRNDWLPKIEKLALAVCFAAIGLLLAVVGHIAISK